MTPRPKLLVDSIIQTHESYGDASLPGSVHINLLKQLLLYSQLLIHAECMYTSVGTSCSMVLPQPLVVQVQLGDICQTQVVHTAWHLQHNAKVNISVQLKAPGLAKQAVTRLPGPTITAGLSEDCTLLCTIKYPLTC